MKPVYIIQNWASEGPGHIRDYLDHTGHTSRVIRSYNGEALPDPAEAEALIVMGCPISVTEYLDHDHLKRLFACMAAAMRDDTPLLGICFGGQMLAKILGARVEKNPVKEIGIYPAQLTDAGSNDPLLAGFEKEFNVFHWHGDTFRVPSGVDLLVKGETCTNQAFRKGRAVALQFHVETTAADVPVWCDEYAAELSEIGKTKDQMIAQFAEHADDLAKLTPKLLGNFFGL